MYRDRRCEKSEREVRDWLDHLAGKPDDFVSDADLGAFVRVLADRGLLMPEHNAA
jgi:hypothetical protein